MNALKRYTKILLAIAILILGLEANAYEGWYKYQNKVSEWSDYSTTGPYPYHWWTIKEAWTFRAWETPHWVWEKWEFLDGIEMVIYHDIDERNSNPIWSVDPISHYDYTINLTNFVMHETCNTTVAGKKNYYYENDIIYLVSAARQWMYYDGFMGDNAPLDWCYGWTVHELTIPGLDFTWYIPEYDSYRGTYNNIFTYYNAYP